MPVTRSNRTASPTPSENSYWNNFDNDDRVTPSPAPSETADPFGGWDSDTSSPPMDSTQATPTPARPTSPASVMEIEDPTPIAAAKSQTKASKKGKKKAKAGTRCCFIPSSSL